MGAAIGVAAGVIVCAVVVAGAVQLYDQPRLAAEEVGEIGTDRDLAAEFVACELAIAEVLPEEAFGW